jgi:2-polyprenyl-3-methyl-5-hydroxy-6-metoxy-1,4-benzoquinol methylase
MQDRDQETLNRIWDLYHAPVITSGKLSNRLLSPVRAFMKLLLGPFLSRQAEYNAANTRILNGLLQAVGDLRQSLGDLRQSLLDEVRAQGQGLGLAIDEVRVQAQGLGVAIEGIQQQGLERHRAAVEQLQTAIAGVQQQGLERHRATVEQLQGQIQEVQTAITASTERAYRAERGVFSFFREVQREELPLAQLARKLLFEFDYFAFEQRFRGSEDEIRRRQRIYVEYFANGHDVLDVGCGRGEFLELLREIGVTAKGIDTNPEMVLHCQRKGLNVEEGEVFQYLESQPDGSLGGIFTAQMIEHLPFEVLNKLIKLCYLKLASDGVLVAETLNPHCPTAMRWFYLDPTHIRPIFPEMLEFLCTSSGFHKASVRYTLPQRAPTDGEGREMDASNYGEYAVIAWKGSGA